MANTDNLPYSEVSFKASHNSYDRDETTHEQLVFHLNDPARCGCRGLELDIWRHSDRVQGFFTVSHTQDFGQEGPPLTYYLGLLLSWHLNNPGHDVVTITIDIKSSHGSYFTFPDEIDNYLREYFYENIIFKPSSVLHTDKYSLCRNVIEYGWPILGDMRDKFIFCLSGTTEWKNYYASLNMHERLCFADQDFDDNDESFVPPSDGNFVFFNTNIFSDHHDTWKVTIPKFKPRHLIVRAYEIDGQQLWDRSLSAGVSILATNEVSGRSWAKVADAPFTQRS